MRNLFSNSALIGQRDGLNYKRDSSHTRSSALKNGIRTIIRGRYRASRFASVCWKSG
jgi:hypothetical protein